MRLTLRDTVTGEEVAVDEPGFEASWWADGNGSCDCNRARYFDGADDTLETDIRTKHPGLKQWQDVCYGARRILIVAAETDEYTLAELNASYPQYGGSGT